MPFLSDIDYHPTRHDATISIYEGRCILSRRACAILALRPEAPRVRIRQDMEQAQSGRIRIYIGHSNSPVGYVVKRVKGRGTGQISSASLARTLASALDGYGTYRIQEEIYTQDREGQTQYEIFFRKYQSRG